LLIAAASIAGAPTAAANARPNIAATIAIAALNVLPIMLIGLRS
jgi:hypothetical protein